MLLALLDVLLRVLGGSSLASPFRALAQLMNELEFRVLLAAGMSFVVVMLLGKPVIGWLRRQRIGDTGATDAELNRAVAQSKANTPTMGGVLIAAAVLAAVLLLCDLRNPYVHLAIAIVVWLAALGGVDDWLKLTAKRRGGGRQGLYMWEKLVFQLGLGALVGVFSYAAGNDPGQARDIAHVLNLPFQRTYDPTQGRLPSESLIYLPAAVFVLAAVFMVAAGSNAANISDGMDGLAAGVGVFVCIGVIILAIIAGTEQLALRLLVPHVPRSGELAVVTAALLGALLGFLWFNTSPALVFMGDCGALTIGGVLGYVAVVIRQEVVVITMCGVYAWELASVVLQVGSYRLRNKKRIFLMAPYHHHLHHKGWPEQRVVIRFWLVSMLLVIAALATLKLR